MDPLGHRIEGALVQRIGKTLVNPQFSIAMKQKSNSIPFLVFWWFCGLAAPLHAQPDGATFQRMYQEGSQAFAQGYFLEAGKDFAAAFQAMPNHHAALMAARSFAAAHDTTQMLQWVGETIQQGRYRLNQPEFDPFRQIPAFQKWEAEAKTQMEWLSAERPEPNYYTPYDFDPQKSYPLVVYLHGYGSDANLYEPGYLEACNAHGFIWVAVRGMEVLGRDAFSWNGQLEESKIIRAAIEKAQSRYSIDPSRIFIFGYDVGGSAAWKFQEDFPGILAGIGITDYDMPNPQLLVKQKERDTRVFVMTNEQTQSAYRHNLGQLNQYCKQQKIPFQIGSTDDFFPSLDEMLTWFLQ
jgi:predicted esterase